jgi:hypothetical protein
VKIAILFSCIISAGFIAMYSVVMAQVRDLESFYGNLDQYAQTATTSNNPVGSPYVPQPLVNVSQPLKNSTLQK